MPSLTVDTVLVPVDGSDESATAAEHAVAVADRYDAAVHVLYVLGEAVARGIDADDVAETTVAEENRAFVGDLREHAVDAGVPLHSSTAFGFSTRRKTQHPGSVILDCAEEVHADFLVVPRESTSDDGGDVLEKAAEYVLLYASQPVLSV
jgi:nucleotide-binding universal stress UspA family protein